MNDNGNIVEFRNRIKDKHEAEQAEYEGGAVVCPFCKGVDFAVTIDEKTACIDYLICISEECDGDVYMEVHDGIVSEDVYKLDIED
jgi:hypothetical protein